MCLPDMPSLLCSANFLCGSLQTKDCPGRPGDRSTNFVVDLGSNLQRCKRLSIQSINFPNNFYNVFSNSFNRQSNNIQHATNNTDPATQLTSTANTPGYYNTANLMSAVISSFSGSSSVFTINAFTQDPISQLCTITVQNVLPLSVSFIPNGGDPLSLLGFAGTTMTIPGFSTSSFTATNLPGLAGLTEVFITSSALAPSNAFDEKGQLSNVLLGIPITSAFGQLNVFDCKVDILCEVLYPLTRDFARCDFILVDRNGNEVNLNGGNIKMDFRVWFDHY